MFYDQSNFPIRFDWALPGIRHVAAAADTIIIVDALSFSTAVDVATARGAKIFPCRWKDRRADDYAGSLNAHLAVPRNHPGKFSLSPLSMQAVTPETRIVLPSPNGSELTMEAESLGRTVLTACFRNCQAVAQFAAARGGSIAVIAAGERWPDGSLRPALEDLAAAGALISHLAGEPSPEAAAARAAWNLAQQDLPAFLAACASGRELIEMGFADDVKIAAELNVSTAAPLLHQHHYAAAN